MRRLSVIAFCLTALIPLTGFFFTPRGHADELSLLGSLAVREEYNDNLDLEAVNRRSSFITTITPAFTVRDRTERLDAMLEAKLNGVLYSVAERPDVVDQQYRSKVAGRLTPALGLEGSASYLSDTRTDRELEETGLVFRPVRRHKVQLAGSSSLMLDEVTTLSGQAGYDSEKFTGDAATDNKTWSFSVGLARDLHHAGYPDQAMVTLAGQQMEFSDSTIRNVALSVGWNGHLTESWRYAVEGGLRYTDSELTTYALTVNGIVQERTQEGKLGGIGSASLTWQGEKASATAALSHDIVAASGRSGAVNRTSASLGLSRRFTDTFSGSLTGSYFSNAAKKGELGTSEIDQDTYLTSATLRYQFSREARMEGGYYHTWISNHVNEGKVTRSTVSLSLVVEYPFL